MAMFRLTRPNYLSAIKLYFSYKKMMFQNIIWYLHICVDKRKLIPSLFDRILVHDFMMFDFVSVIIAVNSQVSIKLDYNHYHASLFCNKIKYKLVGRIYIFLRNRQCQLIYSTKGPNDCSVCMNKDVV